MNTRTYNLLLVGAILTLLFTSSWASSLTMPSNEIGAQVSDTPSTCTPITGTTTSTSLADASTSTSTGTTKFDPLERFKAGEISGELCHDLIWQAEQEGISLEESIERYAWQGPLSFMVNEIREAYPDDYAGSTIEKDFTVWIAFAGEAPADAVESIRSFPRDIQIIENRGFTEAGLNHRLHVVFDIVAANDKVVDPVGYYDIATGQIEIELSLDDSVDTPTKKARVLDRILADIPPGRDGTINDIKLTVLNPLLSRFLSALGGGGTDDLPEDGKKEEPIEPWMLMLLIYLAVVSLLLVPFLLYETLLTAVRGQTVGKKLARMRTVRADNGRTPGWARTSARWSVLHLPLLIPIIGIPIFLLTAASPTFNRRRRGWHEKITGTKTVPASTEQPTEESNELPAGLARRLLARTIDWTICAAAGLALLMLTLWLLGLEGHLY